MKKANVVSFKIILIAIAVVVGVVLLLGASFFGKGLIEWIKNLPDYQNDTDDLDIPSGVDCEILVGKLVESRGGFLSGVPFIWLADLGEGKFEETPLHILPEQPNVIYTLVKKGAISLPQVIAPKPEAIGTVNNGILEFLPNYLLNEGSVEKFVVVKKKITIKDLENLNRAKFVGLGNEKKLICKDNEGVNIKSYIGYIENNKIYFGEKEGPFEIQESASGTKIIYFKSAGCPERAYLVADKDTGRITYHSLFKDINKVVEDIKGVLISSNCIYSSAQMRDSLQSQLQQLSGAYIDQYGGIYKK